MAQSTKHSRSGQRRVRCLTRTLLQLGLVSNLLCGDVFSFTPTPHRRGFLHRSTTLAATGFDMSKPVFDLYSFRTVRGDALTKYSSLNQSEPLRINLFALAAGSFFASPWLVEEIFGSQMPLPQLGGAALAGVACSALFFRECKRRSRQLTRLEKELSALSLQLRLPSNLLADSPFQDSLSLRELALSGGRTIAISGTASELSTCLEELSVLGRRLTQASAYVVAVPTDGSTRKDWYVAGTRPSWLAEVVDNDQWKEFFGELSEEQLPSSKTFRWFGISATGRSFGSGNAQPSWLQILGRSLSPTAILDPDDAGTDDGKSGLATSLQSFYSALTSGDLAQMGAVFDDTPLQELTEIVESGGRLDSWEACLADGARPAEMITGDGDFTVLSDTKAFSTTVEHPANVGGATLLAVQEWSRKDSEGAWKLVKHQTIPWSERPAGGTLICDCRGCVSLVRS